MQKAAYPLIKPTENSTQMNNLDFEKTQVWAKNLIINANDSVDAPPMQAASAVKPIFATKKTVLKPLTREEKITLAAGGALAIGLGAIVISSFSDVEPEKVTLSTQTNLTAPQLNLGVLQPEVKVSEPEINKAVSEPFHRVHHAEGETHPKSLKPGLDHALLEIPENPQIATCVGDELTFVEAFNAARSEVGPAGLFAWRETYYSTFTDKEWQSVPGHDKEKWLIGAQPIIEPEPVSDHLNPDITEPPHAVVVAERGSITWTGIDKNGDGQAEILVARINGQSPMVIMDTDNDGILDTRYDYDATSGKTYASLVEPFSMSIADIEQLEYVPVESDMGFFNQNTSNHAQATLPVMIHQENNGYVVSLDSNQDNTVDAITYLSDDKGPVVGLDYDNDGQIEMGFVYDNQTHTLQSAQTDPLEEMFFGSLDNPMISMVEEPSLLIPYEPGDFSFEDDQNTDDVYFKADTDESDDEIFS